MNLTIDDQKFLGHEEASEDFDSWVTEENGVKKNWGYLQIEDGNSFVTWAVKTSDHVVAYQTFIDAARACQQLSYADEAHLGWIDSRLNFHERETD